MAVILAEYFVTIDNTLLFIAREEFEKPLIKPIAVTVNDIRQFATSHFGTLAGGTNRMRNLDQDEWQRQFGQLIEPLSSYTEPGDTIWFVPHDALHYFPLHALQIEGQYLIERNPVCYTPSASTMKFCRAKRSSAFR